MTNLERFSELTMSKQALLCFAVSTLRMMDLDILSSASSLQLEKIAHRKKFLETFADYGLPREITASPNGLNGNIREFLFDNCARVESRPNKIAIITELCFIRPWDGMRLLLKKDIEDNIRRLAIKEVAAGFNLPDSDDSVDTLLDSDLKQANSALKDWPKIGKAVLLSGVGACVGGLFLAPHIGAAIGGAMGLSGAAATSAGLAFVGGGSLAAGGLGMAGGSIIIGSTLGLITGTGAGIATNLAGVNADATIESKKLYVMLQMLGRSFEKDLVLKISTHLLKNADQNKNKRIFEEAKEKEQRDKHLIKRLAAEEKMLRAIAS